MDFDWVLSGTIWGQSLMLGWAGYMLMNGVRLMRRGTKIIEQQQALLHEQMDQLFFQAGLIAAMQAGVLGPQNIKSVDLRNLPFEIRIAIWRALIEVAIELRKRPDV